MHQHGSKRKKIALRFFSYGVMTFATIAISFICILLILGYQFNLQKGTVEQGALLQFRSFPSGATITLNGTALGFRTPGKENVEVGKHTVTMTRQGYREWSKSFSVTAGELRWLNYVRFVPNTVTTNSVRAFDVLSDSLPSPDRRWMALYGAVEKPEFTIADIRDENNLRYQSYVLPAGEMTTVEGQTSQFSFEEWDFGARYLLIQHRIGETVEYLRADRTDAGSVRNVSKIINLPISDIHFSGTSGNVFYALINGDVRKLDIAAGTVSAPLASNVTSFRLFKADDIAYVTSKDNQTSVGIITNDKASIVRTYDASLPVLVDLNEYFDHLYLAIGRGTKVDIIKDPATAAGTTSKKVLASTTLPEGVRWVRFAASGRFIVGGNGNHFVTHDLETVTTSTTALPGVSATPDKPLQWLDDYYFISDAEGSLRLTEFDGANQNLITDVAPGFPVTLSSDGSFLYSISKEANGYALQSSKMTLE